MQGKDFVKAVYAYNAMVKSAQDEYQLMQKQAVLSTVLRLARGLGGAARGLGGAARGLGGAVKGLGALRSLGGVAGRGLRGFGNITSHASRMMRNAGSVMTRPLRTALRPKSPAQLYGGKAYFGGANAGTGGANSFLGGMGVSMPQLFKYGLGGAAGAGGGYLAYDQIGKYLNDLFNNTASNPVTNPLNDVLKPNGR